MMMMMMVVTWNLKQQIHNQIIIISLLFSFQIIDDLSRAATD